MRRIKNAVWTGNWIMGILRSNGSYGILSETVGRTKAHCIQKYNKWAGADLDKYEIRQRAKEIKAIRLYVSDIID